MKIIELEIEGFRSFKHQTWRPGDLNVLIGPNAGGKSNLLKVLEALRAAADGELAELVQREGGMDSVVWDGQARRVRFRAQTTPLAPYSDPIKDALTYELLLARLGTTGSFEIERELLANFHSETEEPLKLLERDPGHAVVFSQAAERFDAVREFVSERDSLLSLATGPFAANRFAAGFQRELSEWEIHHAIQTQRDAMIRTPQIVRPESRLSPDGQNLVAYLHNLHETSHEFKGAVTTAMQAAFGPDFVELRFPPAAEQRIQLEIRWRSLKRARSASDLSDGTLRFLFLIAILANPQPPPLIAIDEPETGLHPSMLRIVAEYARQAAERTQVVLTTHSPAFLDSFGDDPPITTIVEFRGGETGLRNVDPDQLAYWLKQFTLGELFRSSELEAMP